MFQEVERSVVFQQIQSLSSHSPGLYCSFMDVVLVNGECKGFESACIMCSSIMRITSQNEWI